MSRLSCVQNCLCPDYRAFKIAYVQTIVRSKLHMSRLSCVQNCICPDYRAFIFFPVRVILNARRHLVRSFRSEHIDFRSGTSTWECLIRVASGLCTVLPELHPESVRSDQRSMYGLKILFKSLSRFWTV